MKKIISMAMAVLMAAMMTGCGSKGGKKAIVPNDNGEGYAMAEIKPRETLPKVKPRSKTEHAAVIDDGNTETTASGQDIRDITDEDGNITDSGSDVNNDGDGVTSGDDGTDGSGDTAQGSTKAPVGTTDAADTAAAVEEYYLEGIVCAVDKDSVVLNEEDFSRVDVKFDSAVKLNDIKAGDRVLITYDGELPTRAPYQAKGATAIKVTEKAPKTYTMQTYTKNDLKFSILVPDDWSSREIEYPTEGDFTDWGVRFTAKGAAGGLDISWHSAFAIRDPYDIKTETIHGNKVKVYSKQGKWRFYVYDNDYIAAVSFGISDDYSEYDEEMRFMLESLMFE